MFKVSDDAKELIGSQRDPRAARELVLEGIAAARAAGEGFRHLYDDVVALDGYVSEVSSAGDVSRPLGSSAGDASDPDDTR